MNVKYLLFILLLGAYTPGATAAPPATPTQLVHRWLLFGTAAAAAYVTASKLTDATLINIMHEVHNGFLREQLKDEGLLSTLGNGISAKFDLTQQLNENKKALAVVFIGTRLLTGYITYRGVQYLLKRALH